MITSEEAQSIALNLCKPSQPDGEKFIVHFCELSPKQDYWIIRCNSERYILHNQFEHCYVGVNAYLVNVQTGQVDIVGSGENVDTVLQDKYDLQFAENNLYVLVPLFTRENKEALINLKQWLECGYSDAINLISQENNKWLTGKRRFLEHIQEQLKQKNIDTEIILVQESGKAVHVDRNIIFLADIKKQIIKYIHSIK